jgi:hypothetical protein
LASSLLASVGKRVKNLRSRKKMGFPYPGVRTEEVNNESYSFLMNFLVMWPSLYSHM